MTRRKWLWAGLGALLLLGVATAAYAQPFLVPPAHNPFNQLMQRQQAFRLEGPMDRDYDSYLAFYGLNFKGVRHAGGYIPAGGEQIFTHVFHPPGKSRGTVVTMHGYFVHTGLLVHLIDRLLREGYSVVAIDLPGHGLSSGPRASITEFVSYSATLGSVCAQIGTLPGPRYLIGHSTGGAGSWEYLLQQREHGFAKAALVAPLVRSAYWDLSLLGFTLGQSWLTELPRMVGPTSTDPTFFEMVHKDPLQYPGTPVQWVRALIHWNAHVIESYAPSQVPLLILQGTDDTVVDYVWNIPFLRRKFPRAKVQMLQGARHDLLWEAPAVRQKVFDELVAFLKASS